MEIIKTMEGVVDWTYGKKLDTTSSKIQLGKILEEYGELQLAILTGDVEQIKDALGDIPVVMTVMAVQEDEVDLLRLVLASSHYLSTPAHLNMSEVAKLGVNEKALVLSAQLGAALGTVADNVVKSSGNFIAESGAFIFSTLNAIAEIYDTTLEECYEDVLGIISKRTGETTEDGIFKKDL